MIAFLVQHCVQPSVSMRHTRQHDSARLGALMDWIDWGDAPAWVAAIVAIVATVYAIKQARGAKDASTQADRRASAAEKSAEAAQRAADAAEVQANEGQRTNKLAEQALDLARSERHARDTPEFRCVKATLREHRVVATVVAHYAPEKLHVEALIPPDNAVQGVSNNAKQEPSPVIEWGNVVTDTQRQVVVHFAPEQLKRPPRPRQVSVEVPLQLNCRTITEPIREWIAHCVLRTPFSD